MATSTPVAQTPNQIASQQPTQYFNSPTASTTGTMQAPAVVSSTAATNNANQIQTNVNNQVTSGQQIQGAKTNLQTTYDAQGNMVQTGGTLPNGTTYTNTIPKGAPGYVPNPADVAQQSQNANQQQQIQQQLSSDQALLTAAQGAGYSGNQQIQYDANGNIIPTSQANSTVPIPPIPPGTDVTTQSGQAEWYTPDPQGYQEWANATGVSSAQQFQVAVLAGNQQIQSLQTQGNNALQQYLSGTYPLTTTQQAQVAGLQQMWNATISAQQQANSSYVAASAMASARAGGQYDPLGSLAEAQQAIQEGLSRVAVFQGEETTAVNAMINGFQDNDYKAVTDNLAAQEKSVEDITNNLKTVNDAIVKAQEDAFTQQQTIATTQYNEVTKPIQDITETAVAAGAPQAVQNAISNATTVADAIDAAGDWLQTSTDPTVEAYLEYKRPLEASGQTPVSYLQFQQLQNQIDINKAADTAAAEEQAKNNMDEAMGILPPAQQEMFKDATAGMASDKVITGFQNIQSQYAILQKAVQSNDPASEATALATFIQTLVPNAGSLRGSFQALDGQFGTNLSKLDIGASKTVNDIGTLSSADLASISKAATTIMDSQIDNYANIRQSYVDSAEKAVPGSGKMIPNFMSPASAQQYVKQATATINSFYNSQSANTVVQTAKGAMTEKQILYNFAGTKGSDGSVPSPVDIYNFAQQMGYVQ